MRINPLNLSLQGRQTPLCAAEDTPLTAQRHNWYLYIGHSSFDHASLALNIVQNVI